jgi:hypothetical protein
MKPQAHSKDRFVIVMAGGRGERFWPVSREKMPKQLLALLGKKSFLQETVDRVLPLVPVKNIFVITNETQLPEVRKQLPKIPRQNLVAEPVGRNTCAAVTPGAALVGARSMTGVMAFLPAQARRQKGFPRLYRRGRPGWATRRLALAFDPAGVDVLELGVPFSDPLADGLVNQLAAQRGLEFGATPPKVLETVAVIRRDSQIPIVLYIYFNLIHRAGLEQFIKDAAKTGVDGMLVLDLPPEESDNYESLMRQAGLCHIYLIAPAAWWPRWSGTTANGSLASGSS